MLSKLPNYNNDSDIKEKKMYELTIPQKSIADTENYSGELLGVIGGAFFVNVTLDKAAMNKALNLVVEHNDNYCIRFSYENNEMKQYVSEFVAQQFEVRSFNSMEEYRTWISGYSKTLIEKNDGIFEFIMIELPSAFGIVMRANHKVNDDIGMFLTKTQLTKYYDSIINNEAVSDEDNSSYIDYIMDEEKYTSGKKFINDSNYWHELINEHNSITKIADNDNNDLTTARNIYEITGELQAKIEKYCSDFGVNEYNLLFSAFGLLMRRKLHKNDIYVITTLSNRSSTSSKNTLGMYIDIIPVYINADTSKSISEYISSVGSSIVSSIRHRRYGYNNVLKEAYNCGLSEKISDVYFAYLNSENAKEDGEMFFETFHTGVQVESIHMIARVNTNKKLEFNYYYHSSQFSNEEIELFNKQYNYLLEKIINEPNATVADMLPLCEDEYSTVTEKFNDTKFEYDTSLTVCDLLDKRINSTPDKTAVIFRDKKMTYRELDEKSNSLAHKLIESGVSRGVSVAVISDRSVEMIIALIAIMTAGGNYVPISFDLPENRIRYIIDDCKPSIILTHGIGKYEIFNGMNVIDLADKKLYNGNNEKLKKISSPEDLLYIIYTSGTTGNPKGVMIKHSSVVNYCLNNKGNVLYPAISAGMERIACLANISFDIFVTESWDALINGMTVYVADEHEQIEAPAFSDFIIRNDIEVVQITPSRLKMLMLDDEYTGCFRKMKYIMVGAEKVTRSLINRLCEITDASIADVYGPTETTVWSTYWGLVK